MAQGFQRTLAADGKVVSLKEPSKLLWDSLTPQVTLFLSDVEVDTWSPADLKSVVSKVAALVVTRGEKGASLYTSKAPASSIPALTINAVDTNGAGDTFATAYMLAMRSRASDAGKAAAYAASRVCLQPQTCKPHCLLAILDNGLHGPRVSNQSIVNNE